MKLRISRSEVDSFISSLISKGDSKVSDKKSGTDRIIITTKVRIIAKCNGWVEVQPLNLK